MNVKTGISDINLYTSTFCIDTEVLEQKREISRKMIQESGFISRSVIPPWEDSVTLAVNAAKPVVERVSPEHIGLVIVATESGLDFGKPISTYVQDQLGIGPNAKNFEMKHACYGGTAAVRMALCWVASEEAAGRKALVVCTDIARPHFDNAAEFTGGSGAVAMIIDKKPALVEIDPVSGTASKEIYDVARPSLTVEWADPVLSLCCYFDLLEASWLNYCKRHDKEISIRDFNYFLYHTPLLSLIKQSHQIVLELNDAEDDENCSFDRMTLPALDYNFRTGNIYSGSVYAALLGLIYHLSDEKDPKRVAIFSYGSGACSELFSATVLPGAARQLSNQHIMENLKNRCSLSVEAYEQMAAQCNKNMAAKDYIPPFGELYGKVAEQYKKNHWLVLDNIDTYHRHYRWEK
ncbi:hydroxymethylglutaryl-CoA synthase [Legionella antarctica]|uniref:Hydroxymethylglutaryl-CoA synthase n=1 Tax=Legionella antarctica TaxID=2708020 RepID=A0A6F8T7K9_9GAMM|nr:hydroxymethylglutaryl-CoA synthase family protein [Legionella antarctica]BCA96665.1 hydroxymethylglutaryl-CoA synthase [Legionella antarctica]